MHGWMYGWWLMMGMALWMTMHGHGPKKGA